MAIVTGAEIHGKVSMFAVPEQFSDSCLAYESGLVQNPNFGKTQGVTEPEYRFQGIRGTPG